MEVFSPRITVKPFIFAFVCIFMGVILPCSTKVGEKYLNTADIDVIITKRDISRSNGSNIFFSVPDGVTLVTIDEYLRKIPDQNVQKSTELLLRFCPNTDLCQYMYYPEETRWNGRACCLDCDCDASCVYRETCCPHVQHNISANNAIDEEHEMLTCQVAVILDRNENVLNDEFYFVATCPIHADPKLKDMCEREIQNERFAFEDVLPVTDKTKLRNYKNKHCAACHNIPTDRLELWSPYIRCRGKPLSGNEWSTIEDDILTQTDCYVLLNPPSTIDINETRCSLNVITECNVTGLWTVRDEQVESTCRDLELRHKVLADKAVKIYRNIFCAICNGETFDMDDGMDCNYGETTTIFKLLVSIQPPNDNVQRVHGCVQGFLYDPITDQCKRPTCSRPLAYNPNDYTCRNMIEYISRGVYIISFRIVSEVMHNVQLKSAEMLKFEVMQLLQKAYVPMECPTNFIFKLNQTYDEATVVKQTFFHEALSIREFFLEIQVFVHDQRSPSLEINRIISALDGANFTFNTSLWTVTHGQMDDLVQQGIVSDKNVSHVVQQSSLHWDGSNTALTLSVSEDPYDHMVIVGGFNQFLGIAHVCLSDTIQTYGYLNCSAFVYELSKDGFERVPDGLVWKGSHTFEFGEFQSRNASHVAVCTHIVKSKINAAVCCRNIVSTFTSAMICLFAALFMS